MHRSVGDLQILPERLPVTTEGLRDYVLLAREKVQAYGIVLKSLDRQGRQDVYEQTLREGQIVGEQALHAEAALGRCWRIGRIKLELPREEVLTRYQKV